MRFRRIAAALALLLAVCVGSAFAAEEETWEVMDLSGLVFRAGAVQGPESMPEVPAYYAAEEQTPEEKLYARILEKLIEREGFASGATELYVDISDLGFASADKDTVTRVSATLLNDHPELFYIDWLASYATLGDKITRLKYRYSGYTEEDITLVEDIVDELTAFVQGLPPLEQLLILHDYLVEHIGYNYEVASTGSGSQAPDHIYDIYGALVMGDAVCQGYTEAYQLLMDRLGIANVLVDSAAMNHIWNAVELDGEWYHVDATWDDPLFGTTDQLSHDLPGYCKHDFFLRSDSWMSSADGGHSDWVSEVECAGAAYDSGYAFNGQAHSLLYDGTDSGTGRHMFFYIDAAGKNLCRGPLKLEPEKSTPLTGTVAGDCGIAWGENSLFYFTRQYQGGYQTNLYRCDLTDGAVSRVEQRAGRLPYLGLRYLPDARDIEVIDSTSNELLTVLPAFSTSWTTGESAIVEVTRCYNSDTDTWGYYAGINWEDAAKTEVIQLYTAWYQNGQLAGIEISEASDMKDGLWWIELPYWPEEAERRRIFVLMPGESLTPLTKAFDAPLTAGTI